MEVLKDYLEKQIDGSYRLWQAKPTANYIDGWIEVPEGAEVYGKPTGSDCPYFHKVLDGQNWYYSSIIHQWSTSGHPVGAFDEILWEREGTRKKEYLIPQNAGGFTYKAAYEKGFIPESWIKVPEGAVLYMHWVTAGGNRFHDKDGNIINSDGSIRLIPWTLEGLREWRAEILWDRETATHPDPLPFVDDEPVRFNSDAFSHKHSSDEPPAYYGNAIRQKPRQRVYAVMGEWSPDWSKAPEWANWWCATMNRSVITGGIWCKAKPSTLCATGDYSAYQDFGRCEFAPSFGYQGDWQDSVRRRPVTIDIEVLVVPAPEKINFTASK